MDKLPDWRKSIHLRDRPVSRYDCIRFITDDVVKQIFSSTGSRPDFAHSPVLHTPRLLSTDIDILEQEFSLAIKQLRTAVAEDSGIAEVLPSDPALRERCPCCGDDGGDGAKDWSEGQCQKCRNAGCSSQSECVRPSARSGNYNPGEDAPHGWGRF